MKKQLRKSNDALADGVCSGIGEYFDIDPIWIRFLFLGLLGTNFSIILVYLILIVVMPEAK